MVTSPSPECFWPSSFATETAERRQRFDEYLYCAIERNLFCAMTKSSELETGTGDALTYALMTS